MSKYEKKSSMVFTYLFLSLFALLCLLPFWYVITISFSNPSLVREGEIHLLPVGFNLKAYQVILREKTFYNSFKVSVFRTLVGSALAITVQSMFAFAVSRRHMVCRRLLKRMVLFAVLFNGGIIPTFLVVCDTHLFDTIWALIIPVAFSPWNVIILTNFFESLPVSLEESARIDGANDLQIFGRICLPLSTASIATILLFIAVSHWNNLMDGVIYINSSRLKPLQVYLNDMVMRTQMQDMFADAGDMELPTLSIQTAAIFASTVPILVVYPFVQRYFVKGVMIGAVKG